MNLAQLGTLVLMNLVGAASPGPDVMLVTRMATRSRRHAMATTLGIHVGVVFWCSLTVLGAAAVLNAFPAALGFVQLIGGAWLMWMGRGMLIAGWAERGSPPRNLEDAAARLGPLRSAFWRGLTTNLSNPKIVLFLSAMIAPLLPAEPGAGVAVLVIVALSLSSLALFTFMSLLISTPTMRQKLLNAGPWIDVFAGIFFLIAGGVLAVRGLGELV
ncbi:LysE family translocator [Corynebacterium halotolerans]|uniref:Arginine exporter n=1 Tax=Corynebacterium halotolerans YIM 70093 = DSM 44683 TaxID=1121362 RepID=M1NP75_9CORY|nr:LysE family transporter [Corynebacterium halotolerans]AGF73173.1 arginine exporter [Corynebacterium halotolerans YIM 70093 = DSM 44683]